jgi:hypothetical protein
MLYRQENLSLGKSKLDLSLPLLQPKLHIQCSPLRWFASTIQMYSLLCPWLLTWSDLEEEFIDDDGGNNDAGAN